MKRVRRRSLLKENRRKQQQQQRDDTMVTFPSSFLILFLFCFLLFPPAVRLFLWSHHKRVWRPIMTSTMDETPYAVLRLYFFQSSTRLDTDRLKCPAIYFCHRVSSHFWLIAVGLLGDHQMPGIKCFPQKISPKYIFDIVRCDEKP